VALMIKTIIRVAAFILALVVSAQIGRGEGIVSGLVIGIEGIYNSGSGGSGPSGPPTVTALSPSGGTTAGGTPVVLTGANFQGATAVAFGANPASSFTYVNSTTIDATSPAGSAGVINVTVTTPLGTSATGTGNQYTYTSGTCSNSMDFSQSCNSQYTGAIF
jgi:hypothetical protein